MTKVTILGTGTSQGIPVIGCDCAVCQSDDPRDKRLRCSALVEWYGLHILIDIGPDFRYQILRANIPKVDGILLTHEHNDHIIGLDDVRPFNFKYRQHIPVYGMERVVKQVQDRFSYIFKADPYPGAPRIDLHPLPLPYAAIHIKDTPPIIPVEVQHGQLPILGYQFGNFTYLTDVKTLTPQSIAQIKHTKTLVLNALHHRPHHSHLNLEEALAMIALIQPQETYLLHISHRMGKHEEVSKLLPKGVFLAYDGLELVIE